MQMVAHGATIGMDLAIGSHTCVGDCACVLHQNFYKRGVHYTLVLTFWLAVGLDTSCTTTLPVSTRQASCLS